MKKYKCPQCGSSKVVKNGRDFRSSDSKYVQRLLCNECGKYFSNATFCKNKNQNKRRLNRAIYKLSVHGMSISNIASYLGTSKVTVQKKLLFMAEEKTKKNEKFLANKKGKIKQVVFDELLTHEHTKCKPLSVSMAVEKNTGFILGFRIVKSPATGRLAAISRRKYGFRPNEEKQGIKGLFDDIIPMLSSKVTIESDKKHIYKSIVKQKLSQANINFKHIRYKGVKDKKRGQGEMLNQANQYDPLYWINHTFAILRYRISRLIRKTWCNTKKPESLKAHLQLFICYYNDQLSKNKKNMQVSLQ